MTLAQWIAANGIQKQFLAKKAGTSATHLSLILSGRRKASPALAKRIARFTKGAVPAASLMSRQNAALAAKGK